MERLTEWDEFGNADIIALSDMMPEIYAELSFGETNALTEALNRLAKYEDTGLYPEDIEALRDREQGLAELLVNISCGCAVPYTRLEELAQAEKDGRLVVLPCKAVDNVWIDGRKAIVKEFFGYKTERYLYAQFYDNMQYMPVREPFAGYMCKWE